MAYILSNIKKIIQATGTLVSPRKSISHFIFDTRRIIFAEESLFFSLEGHRRSGMDFILDAYKKGIRHFLLPNKLINEDFSYLKNCSILFVKDVVEAIQKLSIHNRKLFSQLKTLAITGSYGKTIVKEWAFHLLKDTYNIVRSPNSFNSQIGVPLSVLDIHSQNNFAIFEAGISETNSMKKLENIIQPHIGIFTNLGNAHNSGFKSQIEKAVEKSILFSNAKAIIYKKDYSPINVALEQLKNRSMSLQKKQFFFSWSVKDTSAYFYVNLIQKETTYTVLKGLLDKKKECILTIPFVDDYAIENCIHLWCLMMYLKIDTKIIKKRFLTLQPLYLGINMVKGKYNSRLFIDIGNINLKGVVNALENILQYQNTSHKSYFLLEYLSPTYGNTDIIELTKIIKNKGVDRFFIIGTTYKKIIDIIHKHFYGEIYYYEKVEDFIKEIYNYSFDNDSILIQGTFKDDIEKIIKELEANIHETYLEVNLSHLTHNIKQFQSLLEKDTKMMCMVKALSYGGGTPVAQKIQSMGIDYLAVAYTDEGVELRKRGITMPIMVMCPEEYAYSSLIQYNLEPEIFSLQTLQKFALELNKVDKNIFPIHIKIESGMHRLGIEYKYLKVVMDIIRQSNFVVKSVFSHLAYAGNKKYIEQTQQQVKTFTKATNYIKKKLGYPFIKHILNSKGVEYLTEYQFDMVRLGLGMYGINVEKPDLDIKNVFTFRSTISQLKIANKGDFVGYDFEKPLEEKVKIATVRVGYADGYTRKLGNGIGKVLIQGKEANIIGNICMDMLMVNISHISGVKVGDEVILFGDQLPIEEVAHLAQTIPYEILTGISPRIKRIYKEDK